MPVTVKFGEKLSALLVDDADETRGPLMALLENMDCWAFIVEAQSEPQALLKVQNQTFDLILLNLNQPKACEFEFIQDLKHIEKEKTNPTPILILSEDFTGDDIETLLEFNIKYVLTKPCSPEAITEKVEEILVREKEEKIKSP